MEFHGADGIPRKGHEDDYAAALWLEGPSAFWLHPEGPLSETTPEEWLAKRKAEAERRRQAQLQNPAHAYANMGLLQSGALMQAGLLAAYQQQSAQYGLNQTRALGGMLSGLFKL